MSKRHPNLLSWQWRHYADQQRHPTNLLLHLIAVPLFLLSLLLLLIGLWHMGFVPLVLAAIGLYGALCLQAQVHRLEQNQPPPFSGERDACKHQLLEQSVTFPRFLFSGGWWRAWRNRR
ncbi:Phage terminase, small subunit [Ectopseudomonas mendocina]|uniref:Phage terminase, small subunit n=1 Tax=Ectopseudomonas mendocina TaxID=300 RepID=A0A379IVK3_ECTME|nr:terminase [Pseudomonas mendocina]SUD40265.1 Phage terminase, small subunit [Pseudomonas mendocina]